MGRKPEADGTESMNQDLCVACDELVMCHIFVSGSRVFYDLPGVL